MHDKADIRLVNAHAEGNRCDHDHIFGGHKFGLRTRARQRLHTGMIIEHPAARLSDLGGDFLGAVARLGVDNTCARQSFHQCCDAALRASFDDVANVGAVKTGHHDAIFGYAQLFGNIIARVGVGGGGQREARHMGKVIQQWPQQTIIGPEIMAPFGHAMRLINRKKCYLRFAQQAAKFWPRCPFWRDI